MRQRHEDCNLRSAFKPSFFSRFLSGGLRQIPEMQCSFLFLACIALAASTGPSHLKPLRCVGLLCGSVTQAGAGSAIASGPRALLCLRGGADADAEKPAFTLDG